MTFSLVSVSGGYSPVPMHRLLTVLTSRCRARTLGHMSSVVVAPGLSCSKACVIFLDEGLNPCPLQEDSLPQSHPGSPLCGKRCVKTSISLYAHLQLRMKQASFIFKDVEIEAWRVFTAGAAGGGWLCGASLSLLRMFFMWT